MTGREKADSIRALLVRESSPFSMQAHSSNQVLCTTTSPCRPPGTVEPKEEDKTSVLRASPSTPAQALLFSPDKFLLPCMYDEDIFSALVEIAVARVLTAHPVNAEFPCLIYIGTHIVSPSVLFGFPNVLVDTVLPVSSPPNVSSSSFHHQVQSPIWTHPLQYPVPSHSTLAHTRGEIHMSAYVSNRSLSAAASSHSHTGHTGHTCH